MKLIQTRIQLSFQFELEFFLIKFSCSQNCFKVNICIRRPWVLLFFGYNRQASSHLIDRFFGYDHGVYRVPEFQASRLNRLPPLPPLQVSVSPPPRIQVGGTHTRFWGKGGRGQTKRQTPWYSVY
jgi:hypothetical protein